MASYTLLHPKNGHGSPRKNNGYCEPIALCELVEHVHPITFICLSTPIRRSTTYKQGHEEKGEAADGKVDVEAPGDDRFLALSHGAEKQMRLTIAKKYDPQRHHR